MLGLLRRNLNLSWPVASHPGNRALLNWWMPTPNNFGGIKLYDLLNRNHGTLTNGPTWVSGFGGFPVVHMDGSDDQIPVTAFSPVPANDFTVSAAVYLKSGAANDRTWFGMGTAGATRQALHMKCVDSTFLRFGLFGDDCDATGLSFAAQWIYVTCTMDASNNMAIVLNGKQVGTHAAAGSFAGTGTATIGYSPALGGNWDGSICSVRFQNRALSTVEAFAEYDQWRRGFPDLLNRTPRLTPFAAAGAAGNPWYYRQQQAVVAG